MAHTNWEQARNQHEPECQTQVTPPADQPRWTIEIEYIPGQPIIGHSINRVTGDTLCFVDATDESLLNSPIGEFFAMVRDHFDKA